MLADLVDVANEVVQLLKDGELRAAELRLTGAERSAAAKSVTSRRAAVHEINRAIAVLRVQRIRIERGLEELEENLRFEAQHRLKPVLDALFAAPIAELKKQKRRLSRPG